MEPEWTPELLGLSIFMNVFELSRNWFDWCFENPEKVKPNHSAMYFFIIEHCNRLGWKEKFGLPMQMTMDAIGIKNYRTFSQTLNDLIEFGFIKLIQKSKNQHSSNIVAIVNNTKANAKATTKALDKAMQKQIQKQVHGTVCIDIQYNQEPETIEPITIFSFDDFWSMYPIKAEKKKCKDRYGKINEKERALIKETLPAFVAYKPFASYTHPNPSTYLNNKRWEDELTRPESTERHFDRLKNTPIDKIIPGIV